MRDILFFEKVCNQLNLGPPISEIKKVSGGLMHKMYCLETSNGKYAVKLLNPSIMKRVSAFRNYEVAEELEYMLQANEIPIVSSLAFHNKRMQCVNNQYFYIFNWVEGKTLLDDEVTVEHCKTVGNILAQIHKIEYRYEPYTFDTIYINWDNYIERSTAHSEIYNLLVSNRDMLYSMQTARNDAIKQLPQITSITNGDMDIKNVLWEKGAPKIIDLESLQYGNPCSELFNLALDWAGCAQLSLNYELLFSFIASYQQEFTSVTLDWNVLYDVNFGFIEWLEYNIKRALLIECEDETEQNLGIHQAKKTIEEIKYYHSIKEELLNRLHSSI